MEHFTTMMNMLFGVVIVPLLELAKSRWQMNPVVVFAFSYICMIAMAYGLGLVMGVQITPEWVLMFANQSQVFAQLTHAGYKTGFEKGKDGLALPPPQVTP